MPKKMGMHKEINSQKQGKSAKWHGSSYAGPAKGKTKRGGKPKGSK